MSRQKPYPESDADAKKTKKKVFRHHRFKRNGIKETGIVPSCIIPVLDSS
jgi:hypothetical protein